MLSKTENERQFRIFFTCASIVWTNLKPIWDVSYIRIWGKCRDVFNVFFYDHIDHNIDQVDCYPNHLSILTGTHEYVSSSGVGSTKDFVFESSNLSIDKYTNNWTIRSKPWWSILYHHRDHQPDLVRIVWQCVSPESLPVSPCEPGKGGRKSWS